MGDRTYMSWKTIKLPKNIIHQIQKNFRESRAIDSQSRNFFSINGQKTVFWHGYMRIAEKFGTLCGNSTYIFWGELNSNPSQTSKLAVASKLAELCPFNQFSIAPSFGPKYGANPGYPTCNQFPQKSEFGEKRKIFQRGSFSEHAIKFLGHSDDFWG